MRCMSISTIFHPLSSFVNDSELFIEKFQKYFLTLTICSSGFSFSYFRNICMQCWNVLLRQLQLSLYAILINRGCRMWWYVACGTRNCSLSCSKMRMRDRATRNVPHMQRHATNTTGGIYRYTFN